MRVGILALQGAFTKHQAILNTLQIPTQEVRYPGDLAECFGLIIPGGESTTMTRHIREMGLLEPLKAFAQKAPIFGTCAGMILMSREGILNLLDISVARNAYGRQKDSFSAELSFLNKQTHAIFIRAPRITAIHSQAVSVLAKHEGEAVLVQQNHHLAASFHPELTNDPTIHHYFIQICKEKQSLQQPFATTPTKSSPMT